MSEVEDHERKKARVRDTLQCGNQVRRKTRPSCSVGSRSSIEAQFSVKPISSSDSWRLGWWEKRWIVRVRGKGRKGALLGEKSG